MNNNLNNYTMQRSTCGNYRRDLIATADTNDITAQYHEQRKHIIKITVYGSDNSTWYQCYKTVIAGQEVESIELMSGQYQARDSSGYVIATFNQDDKHYSVVPEFSWMDVTGSTIEGEYGGPKGFLSPAFHRNAMPVTKEAKEKAIQDESDQAAEREANNS